jgi:acetate---CoA ligase (ADP-forming)
LVALAAWVSHWIWFFRSFGLFSCAADGPTLWIASSDHSTSTCSGPHYGVLVKRMSRKGLELMVGAKRDPAWGTVLLLGLGGIWVEALGDVRLLPGGADREQIVEALRTLRSAKLLAGLRGAAPADIDAVVQVVMGIDRLMQSVPELLEIDVNRLMVHARGQGATALDALLVTG